MRLREFDGCGLQPRHSGDSLISAGKITRRGLLVLAAAGCGKRHRTQPPTAKPVNTYAARLALPIVRPVARPTGGDPSSFQPLWDAYKAMFVLPNDEQNLMGQKAIHAAACSGSALDCSTSQKITDVHTSSDFVLWHRAFLCYHEQILGVPLHYWRWDSDSPADWLPPESFAPAHFPNFASNLLRSEIPLSVENFSTAQIAARVKYLQTLSPNDASVQLAQEEMHTAPHGKFGWNALQNLATAAGDPLFYAHHANLDRIAQQIFGNTWPTPTHVCYHFVDSTGKAVCTTLDDFKNVQVAYQDDNKIDTSRLTVSNILGATPPEFHGFSEIRVTLHFPAILPAGTYHLLSGKGEKLTDFTNIAHHGMSDFPIWLDPASYQKALADGVRCDPGNLEGSILQAALVTDSP